MSMVIDKLIENTQGMKRLLEEDLNLQKEAYTIPQDILNKVFCEFPIKARWSFSSVCKEWNQVANDPSFLNETIYWQHAFSPEKWNQYCKDDVISQDELKEGRRMLPLDIGEILKRPCPVFKEKRLLDTHKLVWIPKNIKGKPLTLINFDSFLESEVKFDVHINHDNYWDNLIEIKGNEPFTSGFMLISRDVMPVAKSRKFSVQKAIIEDFNQNGEAGWRVPFINEVFVAMFTEYLSSGKNLYSDLTYIKCEEVNEKVLTLNEKLNRQYHVALNENMLTICSCQNSSVDTLIVSLKRL